MNNLDNLSSLCIRAVWPASPHLWPKLRAFVEFMSGHLLPSHASPRKPSKAKPA